MSTVLHCDASPLRRTAGLLTGLVAVLLLVSVGLWTASTADLGGGVGHSGTSAELSLSTPGSTARQGELALASAADGAAWGGLAQAPAALVALLSLTGAIGVAGLLLTATQRGWQDAALAGAGVLWAVQGSLASRREFGVDAMAPSPWLVNALLAGAIVLTAWYGLCLVQRPTRTLRRLPVLRALLLGAAATGVMVLLGWLNEPAAGWWVVPLSGIALGAGALLHGVSLARRRRVTASRHSLPAWLLVAVAALTLACAVHDLSIRMVWPAGSEPRVNAWYGTHAAVLLLLTMMLAVRLAQLARMLRQLGRNHRAWRSRMREGQRDLHDLRDRLALRERTEGQLKQRDRILRELHDELGHRLVILQDQARRTQALPEVQQRVDTSLLELRMAYDALEPVPRPLNDALGVLRAQLQPALAQAGVTLRWSLDARAAMLVLPAAQTLQLLRIVREALDLSQPDSSIVRGSDEAVFALQVLDGETGRHLRLRISEGPAKAVPGPQGVAAAAPWPARRMLGPAWVKLQRQATMLGAQLVVETQGLTARSGCVLELVMPLGQR